MSKFTRGFLLGVLLVSSFIGGIVYAGVVRVGDDLHSRALVYFDNGAGVPVLVNSSNPLPMQ